MESYKMTRANAGHFEPHARRWANEMEVGAYITICILHDWGFNETTFPILKSMIEALTPAHWEMSNHRTLFVYFEETQENLAISDDLVSRLRELAASDDGFSLLGVGVTAGEAPAHFPFRSTTVAKLDGGHFREAIRLAEQDIKERGIAQHHP